MQLAKRPLDGVAIQQILDDFRFADIGYCDDFDIIFLQREVVEVSTDLAQTHNADPDFPVTHLTVSQN
jgi:hypothetical protein